MATVQNKSASRSRVELSNRFRSEFHRVRNAILEKRPEFANESKDDQRTQAMSVLSQIWTTKLNRSVDFCEVWNAAFTNNGDSNGRRIHGKTVSGLVKQADPIRATIENYYNPAGGVTMDDLANLDDIFVEDAAT